MLPGNTTIGNYVVLALVAASSTNNEMQAVTSGIGTPSRVLAVTGRSGAEMEFWVIPVTAAAKTVTVTTVDGDAWYGQATEVSGGVVSALSGLTAAGTSAAAAITITGLISGDMVFAFANNTGNFNSGAPTSPWVDYNAGAFTHGAGLDVAYQVVTATSVTATWTGSASYTWDAIGLILTSSGGLINPPPMVAFQAVPRASFR